MTCNENSACAGRRGTFITFEGGEGAGKTTHIRFLAEALEAHGCEAVCLREPGGTAIGEKLREIVLDPENGVMSDECELFIYEAARAQIVSQVIAPALERGAVVLCDRFTDSTFAYQVRGRGLDEESVLRANAFACQGIVPDRTILMVAPSAEAGLVRATKNDGADRLEMAGRDFHARVNDAFAELAERYPERIRTVRSQDRKSRTSQLIFAELADLFDWMGDILADESYFSRLDVKRRS